MCEHTHVCMRKCLDVYIHTYMHIHTYLYMCVHIQSLCMHVSVYYVATCSLVLPTQPSIFMRLSGMTS